MSPTVLSLIVLTLIPILNSWGFQIGNEQLTNFLEVGTSLVLFVVAYFRHKALKEQVVGKGNVNILGGTRK